MIDHCVLCSSQDYIGTGTRDLHHPILESAKKTPTLLFGPSIYSV
jgi:hypothetical protein